MFYRKLYNRYWAVLACGAVLAKGEMGGAGDVAYAYHVLNDHYAFNDIYYLHIDTSIPEVDAYANATNFRWAIRNWLPNKSDANDIIFIYIVTHGKGMAIGVHPEGFEYWDEYINYGGYYDENEDEMYDGAYEVHEHDLGEDVNDDGDWTWVGIDEAIVFNKSDVTDDELVADLNSIEGNYSTLIFATNQCFGGGLIDDLSAPDKIVMTAIDETHMAVGDVNGDSISEWTELLFDALHGENTAYDSFDKELLHNGTVVNVDSNYDGRISIREAFNHTMSFTGVYDAHGEYYPQTHWLDDDGNREPTFINRHNVGDEIDNGTLAGNTWFPPEYYNLTVRTYDTDSQEFEGAAVWIDYDIEGPSCVVANVSSGHVWHNVTVESIVYSGGCKHIFQHWEDNSTSNSRFVHVGGNSTITAYYHRECTRYMQNAKWDSTYWKQLLNNTNSYTSKTEIMWQSISRGYLGVKMYKGTTNISNIIQVGSWSNYQSGLKSTTWICNEENVTGTSVKVEIWYKFEGYSWTDMGVDFKTETFGQNTILNATTWTIHLFGRYFISEPLGPGFPPGLTTSQLTFFWGSSSKESRIENMSFST